MEIKPSADLSDEYQKTEQGWVRTDQKLESELQDKMFFESNNVWAYDLTEDSVIKMVTDGEVLYLKQLPGSNFLALYSSANKFDTPLQVNPNFSDQIPIAAVDTEAIFQRADGKYFNTPVIHKIVIYKNKK